MNIIYIPSHVTQLSKQSIYMYNHNNYDVIFHCMIHVGNRAIFAGIARCQGLILHAFRDDIAR